MDVTQEVTQKEKQNAIYAIEGCIAEYKKLGIELTTFTNNRFTAFEFNNTKYSISYDGNNPYGIIKPIENENIDVITLSNQMKQELENYLNSRDMNFLVDLLTNKEGKFAGRKDNSGNEKKKEEAIRTIYNALDEINRGLQQNNSAPLSLNDLANNVLKYTQTHPHTDPTEKIKTGTFSQKRVFKKEVLTNSPDISTDDPMRVLIDILTNKDKRFAGRKDYSKDGNKIGEAMREINANIMAINNKLEGINATVDVQYFANYVQNYLEYNPNFDPVEQKGVLNNRCVFKKQIATELYNGIIYQNLPAPTTVQSTATSSSSSSTNPRHWEQMVAEQERLLEQYAGLGS